MYNIDDAIAKVDGYVISVSGGGPFVGEQKLIRIDEVKRTAAYASLASTGNGDAPPAPKERSEEEALTSSRSKFSWMPVIAGLYVSRRVQDNLRGHRPRLGPRGPRTDSQEEGCRRPEAGRDMPAAIKRCFRRLFVLFTAN